MRPEAHQATPHTPDQRAAHTLLAELRTRIALQPLPYQHGVEASALKSLWEIFALTRSTIKDNVGCEAFARSATEMLNVHIRPVTAKWHRAHQAGLLDARDGAEAFRVELEALRKKLVEYSLELQEMAYGTRQPDAETPPAIAPAEVDICFAPVKFGIAEFNAIENAKEINESEAAEVASRRAACGIETETRTDAVGMALSGGGIRSATFCLGVVQVLAERGLMGQFDYLSTVSGGGYTGSFITSCIGSERSFSDLGRPYGPDTDPVRHVRQNAKYLSAANLRERWLVLVGTLAGMLLNWTAPLFVIAAAGWLAWMAGNGAAETLQQIAAGLWLLAALLLVIYGILLKVDSQVRYGLQVLGAFAGLAAVVTFTLIIELAYPAFRNALQMSWPVVGAAAVTAALPAVIRFIPMFRSPRVRSNAFEALVVAAGLAVPFLAIICFYLFRGFAEVSYSDSYGQWILPLFVVVAGFIALWVLDVNATSPHRIYRDALAKTFVWGGAGAQELPLAEVNSKHNAPYHLINATVNLPSSKSSVLRDRRGDFFLFSKHWTGAPSMGYHKTHRWNMGGGAVDLATAMAVSGAAASPHMGLETRPTLAAILTLINLRLGLWIRHPNAGSGRPGFSCLLREMTGTWMSEAGPWLYLSDGDTSRTRASTNCCAGAVSLFCAWTVRRIRSQRFRGS